MSPGTAVNAFLLAAVGQGRWGHKLAVILWNFMIQQSGCRLIVAIKVIWNIFQWKNIFSVFILFFQLEPYLGQSQLNMLLKY